jgi:PadR family transcriptional regulator, regulatory protein PadR
MSSRAVTEPAFFILTALVDAPRHGYGIVGEVAALSDGRVKLKIGTLYGVLDRLVADGLVELDREEVQQGRLRRYYALTDAGRQALSAEADRQAANARVAADRLRAWKAAAERTTAPRPARSTSSPRPARPATQGGTA